MVAAVHDAGLRRPVRLLMLKGNHKRSVGQRDAAAWCLKGEQPLRLLDLPSPPDAILAFNDIITFAAFTAIKARGLSIPHDVALIGFTDDAHAAYVTPRMSAIEDQSHLMGVTACQLLLKNIAGDQKVYKKIVPQQLVIRETSAKNKKD